MRQQWRKPETVRSGEESSDQADLFMLGRRIMNRQMLALGERKG
jgi:hypothetical protein